MSARCRRMSAESGGLSRSELAQRIADDLVEGMCVNLGIGMPMMVSAYVPKDREVWLHSENGILGMDANAVGEGPDWDLVNVGGQPVGLVPGGTIVSNVDSFALIRGGHVGVSIMGAFGVSTAGDLANWNADDGSIPAVGGAMDLAAGAGQVWVAMSLYDKNGNSKFCRDLRYPLTAAGVVTRVYTELAVFSIRDSRAWLDESIPALSPQTLLSNLGLTDEVGISDDYRPLRV